MSAVGASWFWDIGNPELNIEPDAAPASCARPVFVRPNLWLAASANVPCLWKSGQIFGACYPQAGGNPPSGPPSPTHRAAPQPIAAQQSGPLPIVTQIPGAQPMAAQPATRSESGAQGIYVPETLSLSVDG
jgi:hypothetical protein